MKRNQALDILRCFAILLVLGFHYSYFHWWWQIGWTGVDLFFVLSGFLISGLLFNEIKERGTISLKRFWVRRGFKIYPPYFTLAVLTAVSFAMVRGHEPTGVLDEFLFIQNYGPHIWPHTWSLAVEEHFYFILPLLLLAIKKRPRAVPWIFAALAVACLALRIISLSHGVPVAEVHSETHLRIDSLFCGVAICYWRTFHSESFNHWSSRPLWLGVLLVVPAIFLPPAGWFMSTAGLTLLYAGYGLLLVWAISRPASRRLVFRNMASIGKHSYSIYLWHLPLWALLFRGHISLPFALVGMSCSVAFGILMSKAIEVPSLAVRDRLFPSMVKSKLPAADPGQSEIGARLRALA